MSRFIVGRRSVALIAAWSLGAALHAAPAPATEDGGHGPPAHLRLEVAMAPAVAPVNVPGVVEGTITVVNDGPCAALGVLVHEPFLTAILTDADVLVTPGDPAVTWAVIGLDPLLIAIPSLPEGESVTVRIRGTFLPECWMENVETLAVAGALNAEEVDAPMTLPIDLDGPEVCDGVDNDCDEVVDQGGDALCADGDACTGVETCGGSAGCLGGTPVACDDGDPCTADACAADGSCTATPVPGCGACVPVAETCADGSDEDCDELIDCADQDCAEDAACAPGEAEVCSDCTDNDGDGLVDAEDPDCCTETRGLIVTRLHLQPKATAPRERVRLRARDAGLLQSVALGQRDVGIQLRDRDGELFCVCVAPQHWAETTRHRAMRFHDRQHRYAGGLHHGRLRLMSNGMVQLDTRGDGMSLRAPVGGRLEVRVRVGARCLVAERDLHAYRGIFRAP